MLSKGSVLGLRWLLLGVGVVLYCGLGAVACSPSQQCVDGISNLSLNSEGSPCGSDCDCSNQRYEGVCVNGTCLSQARGSCNATGDLDSCVMLPSPKAGLCREGTKICKDKGLRSLVWGDCKVKIVEEVGALCANGKDDDCDGKVDGADEACTDVCQVGQSRACVLQAPVGLCSTGVQVCSASALWGPCAPQIVVEEGRDLCSNNKDDDCDGKVDTVDEGCKGFCQPDERRDCGDVSVGACRKGSQRCKEDATWGACEGAVGPKAEDCNLADDDCDGFVDEADAGGLLKRACYEGKSGCVKKTEGGFACEGGCKAGVQTCKNGEWSACEGGVGPKEEICNGEDDDCDGEVDEDAGGNVLKRTCYGWDKGCVKAADGSYTCTAPCQAGIETCKEGKWSACEGGVGPTQETCDGKDEDCDGRVDNDILGKRCAYTGPAGTEGKGLCKSGQERCVAGVFQCFGEVLPVQESCHNGVDDDCDGRVDLADGDCSWVVSFGGTTTAPHTSDEYNKGLGLTVDGQNNVYVAGEFVGTKSFGSKQLSSLGGRDAFLVKLDAKRAVDWVVQGGGKGEVESATVTLLGGTRLAWLGSFDGVLTLGSLATSLSSKGSQDVFLGKVALNGQAQSATSYGGTGRELGFSVVEGQNGASYVVGHFEGTMQVGSTNLLSLGSRDGFLMKLDDKGQVLWVNQFRSSKEVRVPGLCTNQKGELYVTGYFSAAIQVGLEAGSPRILNTAGSNLADSFVAKVDVGTGKVNWAKNIHGPGYDGSRGCAVNASGEVVVTGAMNSTAMFGSVQLTSNGRADAFVTKLDKSGTFLWAKSFGGVSGDLGVQVAYDSSGHIYAVGTFRDAFAFDGNSLRSSGGFDAYVIKFDDSGKVLWVVSGGGVGADVAVAVAVAPNGQVVVGGYYSDNATFGPTTLPAVGLQSFVWWLMP